MRYGTISVVSLIVLLAVFIGIGSAVPAGNVISWQGGGAGTVIFEGSEHFEQGYRCDACHPALFEMRQGISGITMAAMKDGRFCGACHNGRAAFSTQDSRKCHECHKGKRGRRKLYQDYDEEHRDHEYREDYEEGHDD